MKKIIWLIFFAIVAGKQTQAQSSEPCAPYNQKRTLTQARTFILKKGDVYHNNYREYLTRVINEGIERITGHSNTYDAGNDEHMKKMSMSLRKVHHSFIDPLDYQNTHRVASSVLKTDKIGQASEYWLEYVFIYDGKEYTIPCIKLSCMNIQILLVVEEKTTPTVIEKSEAREPEVDYGEIIARMAWLSQQQCCPTTQVVYQQQQYYQPQPQYQQYQQSYSMPRINFGFSGTFGRGARYQNPIFVSRAPISTGFIRTPVSTGFTRTPVSTNFTRTPTSTGFIR